MEQSLDEAYKKVEKTKLTLGLIGGYAAFMIPMVILLGFLAGVDSTLMVWFWWALGLLFGVIIPCYVIASTWINRYYRNFRFTLQEQGIFIRSGVITKTERHIPYGRIQNLSIDRGVIQRRYGIATLKIETAGFTVRAGSSYGSAEGVIPGIRNPEEVIKQIHPKLGHLKSGLADDIPSKKEIPTELDLLMQMNETLQQIRILLEK